MVENDVDPREPTDLIFEDSKAKLEAMFAEGKKHRDLGELILQLDASVKAGRVHRQDGSKVEETSDDFKAFADSDMVNLERFAATNADTFYELVDQIEYMEEFSHADLMANDCKVYHSFTDTEGKMVMEFTFPSPMIVFSALFIELDLIDRWLEGASEDVKLVAYKHPTDLVTGYHIDFPVPGKPIMVMDIASVLYLDRKTNGILQIATSMDRERSNWFGESFIDGPENSTITPIKRMFRYIEKIDETKCKHVVVSEFPLSENMNKDFIIEHMIKGRTVERVVKMRKIYDNTIKLYEERVYNTRKDYYDEIAKMFEDDE
eukprot:NODE_1927_length_1033_cov_121.898374_g1568_i0.p1 GENE.NODE_1927_length_1033_cov_121.898374_g1568_i0~~NODE_1927_length_1033_cov_121.898374_g1568_i0.p1  ORF type:complete len:332 (-),score=58.69 NODE_1927_length_1033_cov_121.898374_g1568_i0:36-992(-)